MARIPIRQLLGFKHNPLASSPPNANQVSSKSSSLTSSKCTASSFYYPNSHLLNKCQSSNQLSQVQAHLITCGLFTDTPLAVRLLEHSLHFADIDHTLSIFRSLDTTSTFCVNTVIRAFAFSSVPDKGVVFYFQMLQNRFFPNSYTFVPLFGVCSKTGSVELAKKCHGQAIKNGVDVELTVQNSLIHTYACCGLLELAVKVFAEMPQRDAFSWNSILDGFVKAGNLSSACKLFDVMPERNAVSWNIMIIGYLKAGNPGCALKMFREMAKTGVRVSETTVSGVLSACSRSCRLNEGRSVHGFLTKTFSKASVHLSTALVDMYCKCGKVGLARSIFNKAAHRNLACWNAMILGHCIHGNPEDGLDLFLKLVSRKGADGERISPDEITFIGLLCGCARARLLAEGINYFNQMIDEFSIKPNFAHYWCMANLYIGSGLLLEAEEILRSMPVDEDSSSESLVWANLLSSCRFTGDVTFGEKIATSLIEKEPKNSSYHQLLLNIYGVAGQWEKVSAIREVMKERKVERMPGCNLVDLKEIVHDLKVGINWPEDLIADQDNV